MGLPRAHSVRALLAAATVTMGLAACGSTLPDGDQARLRSSSLGRGSGAAAAGETDLAAGETYVDPNTGEVVTVPDAADHSGTTGSTGSGASGRTPSTAARASSTTLPASAASAGSNAQGVTATEMKVGVIVDRSAGFTNAALGVAGIGQVDGRRAWEAVYADINNSGGIAGRKVKLVVFEFDSSQGQSSAALGQQICSAWTQDDKVFAAMGSGDDNLRACLTKAGVIQVSNGSGLSDSQTFKQFPYLVEASVPAMDRLSTFWVPALKRLGYYTKGYKLGVVLYDEPVFVRAATKLRSVLADEGLVLSSEARVRPAQSNAEIADEVASIRAAVLKFAQEGVTHVQFLATNNAFLQLTFMQNAERQVYRPRYGLTSNDGGQALATLLGSDAQAQLRGSISVGWFPLFDVPMSDYQGDGMLPAMQRCKKLLSDAGETFGDGDPTRNKEAQATIYCDSAWYLRAALNLGGKTVVNQRTWLDGVSKVAKHDSAATYVVTTTAEKHDGMGAYRDAKWFEDCVCFHYTSAPKPT